MKRLAQTPRKNWQSKCESVGFDFYDMESEGGRPYWNESAAYELSMAKVDCLDDVSNELYKKCLEAVEFIIKNKRFAEFNIPTEFWPLIEQSWQQKELSVFGRFDLSYAGGTAQLKLLEFNADTPTSLIESSVVQWFWLKDVKGKKGDQFNLIHELLIERWQQIRANWQLMEGTLLHLVSSDSIEDLGNVNYMAEVASLAGFNPRIITIDNVAWNHDKKIFQDEDELPIRFCFKLYPWEWMVNEEFGKYLGVAGSKTLWVEPIWKMLLSNKQLLVILWELFPNHPNLLPAYNKADKFKNIAYVQKPKLSREGANITIYSTEGEIISQNPGSYDDGDYIYQQFANLPKIDNKHCVIGSWIVGDKAAGIDFRETSGLITGDMAEFVPHYIK